jgi:hypothetical protein
MRASYHITRRDLFLLASAASTRFLLYAGDAAFWNKKDPSQWTVVEMDKLATKSPWARQMTVSPQTRESSGDMGGTGGMGDPGIGGGGMGPGRAGGIGVPGMGGGGLGRGRGRSRGGMPVQYEVVVRWLSAKPLRLALKPPLPESMANDYVISVTGLPLIPAGRRRSSDEDSESADSRAAILDRIKGLTYLEPKGKSPAQPGVVQQAAEPDTMLFGFSRELLPISADDRDVTFTTQIGRVEIKTKFNLKDMRYRDELAL